MLLQVCIDGSAYWQTDILDCTSARFLSKPVSGLNQAHLTLSEATRLICVAHGAVIIEDKHAHLLALIAHENVRGEGEHVPTHATLRLTRLHHVQMLQVRLDDTLSESGHHFGLQRVIFGGI